jgi:S-adenosyl-L-methionine hydrolase (adenosine-forming)
MALITFTSDFGYSDHYVAAVKARILGINDTLKIIDISHFIEHHNIAHGSFVLNAVFRDFPTGTVHITAINSHNNLNNTYIAAKLEGHFFIGPDNGIFSLVSEQEPEAVVELSVPDNKTCTFPAKDIYAPAAAQLATGADICQLGMPAESYKRMLPLQVRATKKQIAGHVIRADHYGNLITNIDKKTFDLLNPGSGYKVFFGRESVSNLNDNYFSVDPGECFLFFNSLGLLEIGINQGNASELLGLNYDSRVTIYFNEAGA